MWLLLGTTITASFFDSLNPSAIAQQMMLQAMIKKKRQIWFFILGIGAANYAMGLAIYYGIAAWVSRLFAMVSGTYSLQIYLAELAAGGICLAVGIRMVLRIRKGGVGPEGEMEEGAKLASQLSPSSLFLMGAAFCMVEITSALPYFGFLAVLTSYNPVFPLVLLFIMIYDFMYMLPLILLYFGYNRLNGTTAIRKLEGVLGKVSDYIVPAAVCLLGAALLYVSAGSIR